VITHSRLLDLLHYDPSTGVFTRRVQRQKYKAGEVAGKIRPEDGYVIIGIDGRSYVAHRLAWLYVYGEWPPNKLDHKNLIKSDNRIENLRHATQAENTCNAKKRSSNKSGWKGVHWNKNLKKWSASISFKNKRLYLGSFNDVKEAAEAYIFAALEIHGEYARFE
jgi:hypothetical protein